MEGGLVGQDPCDQGGILALAGDGEAAEPIRPALVMVPATTVALLVTNAGLMFWRMTLSGGFLLGDIRLTLENDWAALAPELLWPVWGVALGVATFAYYRRRRAGTVRPAS